MAAAECGPRLSSAPLSRCAASGARDLFHRRRDQVSQHDANILPLAGTLHHEHREQVLLRVDPEERSGHPAPEELAGRTGEGCEARMGADGEAETETVT